MLGALVHGASAAPPERSLEGLAELLGRETGGVVLPEEIAWEPSPGFLAETFWGRRVLFLSASRKGKPRDLYRASVRVTLSGQPISVRRLRNLTDTPLGDDAALKVRDGRAVFATLAYGRIQGISILDLDGIRDDDRPMGPFDRALLAVNSFQASGDLSGVGRTDIVLDLPARSVRLAFEPPLLRIDLGEGERGLTYDVVQRTLRGADGGEAFAARAVPEVHRAKPLTLWGVDTVRTELGPGPIAWLEDQVFGAKDTVKRASFAIFSRSAESALREASKKAAPERAKILEPSKIADEAQAWPPPPIPSLWKEVQPDEGEWQPVVYPFLAKLPVSDARVSPPAYFYRTFIRPDVKRPYAKLTLVALDMRQLEIGMQAGFEDPKPLTGPPGDGFLPRDKHVTDRVVATFNGAFKTTHGAYGMMVDRRVLIPPVRGAATVMVTEDGETGLGSWPKSDAIPEDMVSFRQNLDPLVEDGVANPTGRFIWGWQLTGTSVMTQRTALCVTPAGHLYYAFASEMDGPTLGRALRQAGCSYGIHLDMNPAHCGFVLTDIVDLRAKEFNLKLLDPEMKISPDKFVRWSAKDFFYVMVRDPIPKDASKAIWSADGGVQPPPAWLAGIFRSTLTIGSLDVNLTSFERGRVAWRIRAGSKEPKVLGAPPMKLSLGNEDARRVLGAIGLGHTTDSTRYGIAFDGKQSLPLRSSYATLVTGGTSAVAIYAPGETPKLDEHQDAVQLPLLADAGQMLPEAREHGPLRLRGALCVTSAGRVVIAEARHDSSDPLVIALLRVGCRRVVELDRSSSHPAFIHRAGTPLPPMASYETSVLYALGQPMVPHASRWKPEGSEPSSKPTGYDYSPVKHKAAADVQAKDLQAATLRER